jgi:hypothetical protein
MTISLPSKKSITIDVPSGDIQNFAGEFIYNFFMPDEDINDQPQSVLPNIVRNLVTDPTKNVSLRQALRQRKNQRYIPRYIDLTWSRMPDIGTNRRLIQTVSIADNLNKLLDENTISTKQFTTVLFKDTGADGKIQYSITRAFDEILKNQGLNAADLDQSPLDLVKLLNEYTTDQIEGNFLAETFINYQKAGVQFVNKEKFDEIVRTTIDSLKNVALNINLNNKFLSTILRSGSEQIDNIYSDETLNVLPASDAIQERAVAESTDPTVITVADYVIDLSSYIFWDGYNESGNLEYQLVGYLISKMEYPRNGRPIDKGYIIIENPAIANFTDLSVKYNTVYGYSIKPVYLLRLPAIDNDTGVLGLASFLITTKPGPEILVETKETRAPNPPTDFNITWDYNREHPNLTWNFPTDSQRDTKYFQIFKRATITEPFQLIKMYNFNDSLTPLPVSEMPEYNIDPRLIEDLRRPDGTAVPKNYFLDMTFNKEQKAIYTVCSIDAHGFSSNYSTQIEVSFDRNKNIMNKKLISIAGAPKPYPNFLLNQDLFVDSIKTSNAKNVSIYFNPEYLKVYDRTGADLALIKTDISSSYKLQMINIDLQRDEIVTFKIDEITDPVPERNNVEPAPPIQISKL